MCQSVFLDEIYSIKDGPPPVVNLVNEKNNGDAILKIIEKNLVNAVHDISSGGLIIALAEMVIKSDYGLKINKPKKLSNIFEYFYGEDQGRYIIEVDKENINQVRKFLKDNNIFNEIIGFTQKDNFELEGEFKININELYKLNNSWYHNY